MMHAQWSGDAAVSRGRAATTSEDGSQQPYLAKPATRLIVAAMMTVPNR
jgi:hypothetical protein